VGGEPDDWDVIDHFLGENSLPPRFSGDSSGLRHHVDFLPSVEQDEWSNQLRRAIANDSPYDLAVFDADTTSLPLIDMLHVFLRSTPYAHAIVLCDVESSIPFQIAERFGYCQRVVLTRKPLDQTEFSMLANMVVGKVTEQRSRQSSLVFTNNISPSAAHGQLLEAHKLLRAQADQLTERLQDTQLELNGQLANSAIRVSYTWRSTLLCITTSNSTGADIPADYEAKKYHYQRELPP
jgi:hypothetical protein